MKKCFWVIMVLALPTVFAVSAANANNITINDGKYTNTDAWYSNQEDQEVEPNNVKSQEWDLEAFVLRENNLSVIGGYNFKAGKDSFFHGDIFIDTNGDAKYGTDLTYPVAGNSNVSNSFGYDYVFDLDFSATNDSGEYAYTVYSLTDSSKVTTAYYSQNATSNPWRYASDGTEVATGYFSFSEYQTDAELETAGFVYGLTGAGGPTDRFKHYVISGFDLSFLGSELEFLAHTTMACGNDNLIGKGTTPVPEPATMLLFGVGVAGLAGLVRKRKNTAR